MDADALGKRILQDLKNVFRKDPLIDEFDILPACESVFNKCPVIHIEHKVALEDWCVKHVYIYAYSNFLKWRQNNYKIDSATLLSWTSAILLINPEIITAWNVRKELLSQNAHHSVEELKFSEIVLSRKPKSSQVFSHRKWILLEFQKSKPSPCAFQEVTEYELGLCSRIADRYPNNYYAWSHRMWIIQEMLNICLKIVSEELLRMEPWVSSHISDYSGFHYRQFLLSCFLNGGHSSRTPSKHSMVCPIHINSTQDCECEKCHSRDTHETENSHISCYHNLLERELTLLTELQKAFPGHEALWNHRRFVVYECNRIYSNPSSCPNSSNSTSSANSENVVVRCKRYKPEFSCCTTFDWDSSKEESFVEQCLRLAKNNDWEKQLVSKHVAWLKRVVSWSHMQFEAS